MRGRWESGAKKVRVTMERIVAQEWARRRRIGANGCPQCWYIDGCASATARLRAIRALKGTRRFRFWTTAFRGN